MWVRTALASGRPTLLATSSRVTASTTTSQLLKEASSLSLRSASLLQADRSLSTSSLVPRRTKPRLAPKDDRAQVETREVFQPKGFVGKLKNPYKRAGGLMAQLNEELKDAALGAKPKWNPELPRVGDGVEVVYKENMTTTKSNSVTGVVIGLKKRNTYDGSIRILGMVGTSKLEITYPLSSPLVSEVRTLEEAFIHRGRKRVRRSKLYYLRDLPPSNYRVAPSEITMMERRALLEERKEKLLEKERAGMKKKASTSSKKSGKK